jgi:hypothetical protein
LKEQIDLPSPSKIGLEAIPLWRIAFQSDALSALHCIADFHTSIAKYPGIDDSLADLKLSVATTNLDLQIAVQAADTTVSIGWDLQNHLSVENGIIWVFELDMAVNLVHCLSLPTP